MTGAAPSQNVAECQQLLAFRARVDQFFDIHAIARFTLEEAISSLHADAGGVWLVDFKSGELETYSDALDRYFDEARTTELIERAVRPAIQQKRTIQIDAVSSSGCVSGVTCAPIRENEVILGALLVAGGGERLRTSAPFPLEHLGRQAAGAVWRTKRLKAFQDISAATARCLDFDHELDSLLEEVLNLGFEFATISIVDPYRQRIECIRGKNVPPEWIRLASHAIGSGDIQDWVLTKKAATIIVGEDARLDSKIFDRFNHKDLARIFAPIMADGKVVGTIETGCKRPRQDQIITPRTTREVERLCQDRGSRVAQARPYILLELIAQSAIDVLGAGSASIHVYESAAELLVAGAGKATSEFLKCFPPRPDGMGRRAMNVKRIKTVDDPAAPDLRNHPVYAEGVRAMAAVPLSLTGDVGGVLYVHFWEDHRFSSVELEVLNLFARQAEVAIQNTLLVRRIVEATERAWTFSRLQNVIQALAASGELGEVLQAIAHNVQYICGADNVTLYEYFQKENRFAFPPVMEGSFRDRESMHTPIRSDDIVRRVIRDGQSRFSPDVRNDPMLTGLRNDGQSKWRFTDREDIKSSAAVLLRVDGETVGLMFVNYRTHIEFPPDFTTSINTLASSAAIAIKKARLDQQVGRDLERRRRELDALRAVDLAIVDSEPTLQPVLDLILRRALDIIDAKVGMIMWRGYANDIESIVLRGYPDGQKTIRVRIGEGIVGRAALTKASVVVPDVTAPEWAGIYLENVPETRSELAVPLVDGTELLGVLNVEHPTPGKFTEDDRALLETLAVQAVIAVRNVNHYERLMKQIRPLHCLSIIATRMHTLGYSLGTRLRLLMAGITASQGLGFSRAMLFLLDETGSRLEGTMATGARTSPEAHRTWEALAAAERQRIIQNEDTLPALLEEAVTFNDAVERGAALDGPLSTAIRGLEFPLAQTAGALADCVRRGEPILVQTGEPNAFRTVLQDVSTGAAEDLPFACVPLVVESKVIGAVVVDNAFLPGQRAIDPGNLEGLNAFAQIAALSIIQNRLERLKQWKVFFEKVDQVFSPKIAALRTVAASGDGPKFESNVGQLERAMQNFRSLATQHVAAVERIDLVPLILSVTRIVDVAGFCPVARTLPHELFVAGNARALSDAFTEILENAMEAMPAKTGECRLITVRASLEHAQAGGGSVAVVEFADTGPGVPHECKTRIFEPLFTTKTGGSGLGLTIVWDIVQQHKGVVVETGEPGEGARFVVRLPALSAHGELHA